MDCLAWRTAFAALLPIVALAGCAATSPGAAPAAAPAAETSPAPAAAKPSPPADVLAKVGGSAITVEEFALEMGRRGGRQPGQFATVEQRQALLDEMVRARAVVAAAEAAGVADDPEMRAAFDRMLAAQYLRATLEPKLNAIDATPEEIAAHYAAHQEEYRTPARVRAAWVFIETSPKADAAAIEKARQRAEEARSAAVKLPAGTAHLGPVAQQFSEDTSTRYTGGELGWVYLDQAENYRWGADVVRGAFGLAAKGELSPVTRHERGFYFLKLVEREDSAPAPIEKLRAGIRSRILTEKREAARQAFYRELLAGVAVSVDAAKLAAVEPLAPPAPAKSPPPVLPVN